MTDRPPPSHPVSEAALVGAMLLEPGIIPEIGAVVTADDFFLPEAATLFRALAAAHREYGSAMDLTMLHEFIGRSVPVRESPFQLAREWMTTTGGPGAAHHYAKIVAKYARVRRALDACHLAAHGLQTNPDADGAVANAMGLVAAALKDGIKDDGTQLSAEMERLILTAGEDGPAMIPTGIAPLDDLFGGLPRSGVVTILGYPASGKTTAALCAAANRSLGVFGSRQPVRVYSVEQHGPRIAASVLASRTNVAVHSVLNRGDRFNGVQSDELGEVAADFAGADFWLAPKIYTAPEVYAQCAAATAHKGPGLVVVDFIQSFPAFDIYKDDVARIGASMNVVSDIARDYGWCVIVVSQLGKDVAKSNRRPQIADGLGSSVIEQRSDFMLSVWREHQTEHQLDKESDQWAMMKRKAELSVLKNKYGPSGTAIASFNGAAMRFSSPSYEESMAWTS